MKQWLVVFTVLSLCLPILLTGCGGDEQETDTATPTATATTTIIVTATPSPTPSEPVKIGVIGPRSGPMAMAGTLFDPVMSLVEDQVTNTGGILGGREVKFVKRDDRGVVAESAAQAKKLILEDKVTILTWGSVSAANFTAVAGVAEEYKVPYVGLGAISGVAAMKYSACLFGWETAISVLATCITDVLKPKTVAFLSYDASDSHYMLDGTEGIVGLRERLKAKGIDIVYDQYFPQDTQDFSAYLTKIKYLKPDLVAGYLNNVGQAVAINKQITELGGWGSIKYFHLSEVGTAKSVIKMPVAVGTYAAVMWLPGSDEPGMKGFEDAFKQKYGRLPDTNQAYGYNCFWTAIKAIELAGTDDPGKVAQALRSGNLEWDSAWGPLRINSLGQGEISNMMVQVQEGGKLVTVWSSHN